MACREVHMLLKKYTKGVMLKGQKFMKNNGRIQDCPQHPAVNPAKPADILYGIRPILAGGLMEFITS